MSSPYWIKQCLPEVSQYLRAIRLLAPLAKKTHRPPYGKRTPARTLVISRTLIPANGRVGESAAAVARPLQSEHANPLSRR